MKTLSSVLILCLAALAAADDVGVPDPNPATGAACEPVPFTFSEARVQFQVSPAFVRPGRITELCFTGPNAGSFSCQDWVMTMAHNPNSTASCVFADNLVNPVVVYSGALNYSYMANQWVPVRLQCHFDYDGVRDLVVEVKFRGLIGGNCRFSSASDPRATFATGPGSYTATTATSCNVNRGLKLYLTFTEIKDRGGNPVPGGDKRLEFNAPLDGGLNYYAGASFASAPGLSIGCKTIPLALDPLLLASLTAPSVFSGFRGTLDPQGNGPGVIYLPTGPLTGLTIWVGFLTTAAGWPNGVKSTSGAYSFTVQ